jgi:hypothetical protein
VALAFCTIIAAEPENGILKLHGITQNYELNIK